MAVKPTSGSTPPATNTTSQNPSGAAAKPATSPINTQGIINPEAVAKALRDYQKLRKDLKKPFMSGAASLFTDSVVFPEDLLDASNPVNDPKYLHLLFAVLGQKQVSALFASEEQLEELLDEGELEEYLVAAVGDTDSGAKGQS